MKRNLKALGLATFAVFALSAMASSSALALTTHHVTVPTAPAIITGHDETGEAKPVFKITGGEHRVECGVTTYEGTVKEKTNTSITVTPTYKECKVDGVINATVVHNHCAYILEGDTVNEHAGIEIECGPESRIEIKYSVFGSACTVDVGPQTIRGVHYTQTTNPESNKKDITVKVTVATGIKYTETGGGFCPAPTTREDGSFNGGITATAYTEKAGCNELVGTERTTPSATYYDECEGVVQDLELNELVT